MSQITDLKKISFILFSFLALSHITTGLMASNLYLSPTSDFINRLLDIPLAISSLLYGFFSINLNYFKNPLTKKVIQIIMIISTIIILTTLIYLNLLPDL